MFSVPAARPRVWRRQRQDQQHEAARSTTPPRQCAYLGGGGTSTGTSTRSSPRRLSTRRAASLSSTVMMGSSNADTTKDQKQQQLQLPPGTVLLRPGDPIEFWHAQGLVLGNYESPVPGRQSLVVHADTGEQLTIDAGQIIGVWREDEMSGRLPRNPRGPGGSAGSGGGGSNNGGAAAIAAWAEIREEARVLLQSTPARGLDLGPFWRAASSKGKGLVVTPAHAAEFLFGAGSPAKVGLRKRPPFQFRGPGVSFQPSAVERAAAAQVLSGERSRFKRVVSKRLGGVGDSTKTNKKRKKNKAKDGEEEKGGLPLESIDAGMERVEREARGPAADQQEEQEQQQSVFISVGGFKAVDNSVAVTREVADFCRVVAGVKRAATAAGVEEEGAENVLARAGLFEPAFLLILHSLEAFAIGGDEQALNPEAKRVMMEIMGKTNPAAAKSILVDVGLWTARGQDDGEEDALAERTVTTGDETTKASAAEEAGEGAGVLPWSAEALQAAALLGKERARRSANYGKREPQAKVGAPAPFGRHDFRRAAFGVYCIDGAGTSFLDDAFSVDPDTREVFIHITDVQGLVPAGSTLDNVARLRAASEYLPQGPLFMMPPTALKAMSFSDAPSAVNEAVTVGIRMDPKTGGVASSRVMLTTLPPVISLTVDQADRLLEAAEKGEAGEGRLARVAKEIQALEYVGRRSAEAGGRRERGKEGIKFRKGRGGETQTFEVASSRARSLVDELLTVYTEEAYRLCKKAGVAMPSLVGQQDRVASGHSRYGTGPLRRYIDILAQRQMAAILKGSGYLNKQELIETASYLTWRQNKTRASRNEEAGRLSLEALAAHCRAQTKATGLRHAVVPARGTGQGRQVRLEGLGGAGVQVHAKRPPGRRGVAIEKGEAVKVVIERVEPQLKQVVATEFFEGGADARGVGSESES
eukprot:g9502.t1